MGLSELIDSSYDLVNDVFIPLAFSLCLLYFFWGITKYIKNDAGSEKAVEEGKKIMLWGLVALFVVFSIWGIINFIRGEFGLDPFTKISTQ
jgi:hypothetical protein